MYILLVIAGLTLVSCGDDEMVDVGAFKWEKVSYRSKEIRGVKYYVVPQRGGDYTFVMKLSDTKGMKVTCKETYDNPENTQMSSWTKSESAAIKIEGNRVYITFLPNDSTTRRCSMYFSQGYTTQGYLDFVQEGAK